MPHRIFALIWLALPPAALAAHPAPVHWTLSGHPLDAYPANTKVSVELTAGIDPGWHVYALDEPDGGPIATEITLAQTDPLTLLQVSQTPPLKVLDPFYKQPLELFTRTARFTLALRTTQADLQPGTQLHVRVRYQACSASVCLPPRTELLEFALTRSH